MLSLAGAGGGGALSYESLKGEIKNVIANDPFDATVVTVLGGSFLFYVAEKGHNPKVETYWDALVFISTCLSVGYADVFARTPAGKAIASAVMTFGPAMSGAILDGPSADRGTQASETAPELLQVQRAIVDRLDEILQELRAARAT
jgi:voltage-gated potassium channel